MSRTFRRLIDLSHISGKTPIYLVRAYLVKSLRDFAVKRNIRFEFSMFPSRDDYLTVHKRPKFPSRTTLNVESQSLNSVAIVMQGGLLLRDAFTLETLRYYRKLYPNCGLILATWKGESEATLLEAQALGVTVACLDRPSNPGISNTNLQMASAAKGVEIAKSLGYEFVLKTRTDQRLYDPHALHYLKSVLDAHPLEEQDQGNQARRLVALDVDTFKYRIYGLSDFLLFGDINDVLKYWDGSLDSRTGLDESVSSASAVEYSKMRICEVYFSTAFLERTKWPLRFTLDDWWGVLSRRFIIVDAGTLDFFWPKYSTREYLWRRYGSGASDANKSQRMAFYGCR